MKNLLIKGLAVSLVIGFFFVPFLSLYSQTKSASEKVNINTASLEDLQKLPRVGPKIAQRIIDYRKEHGNFKKAEEIMKVKGIGEKTYARMKDMITVETSAQPR